MWKKIKLIELVKTSLVATTICIAMSIPAQAGAAKGKPFIAIQGQIVEIEASVASIEERIANIFDGVTSLEARMTAAESAIGDLQGDVTTINGQIEDLVAQADANGVSIEALWSRMTEVSAELAALRAADAANVDAIAALETDVATLRQTIEDNAGGIFTLNAELVDAQMLINALDNEIARIDTELAAKQNDINGGCSTGYSIRQVLDDGTVICESDSTGTAGSLVKVIAYKVSGLNPARRHYYEYDCGFLDLGTCEHDDLHSVDTEIRVSCPDGYKISGGGFNYYGSSSRIETGDVKVEMSSPSYDGEQWIARFASFTTHQRAASVRAVCLRLN